MTRPSTLALLWLALASMICGCEKDPRVIPATQVVVTLRSGLTTELSNIEATVYDVSGEKAGDHSEFDLAVHPLPFSFTVVPTLKATTDFMLLVSGKDAAGKEVLQSKAIVQFVPRSTIGIQLWLNQSCLGRSCDARETCVELSASEAGCAAIPTLEGQPLIAGNELDAAIVMEADPVVGTDAATPGDTDAARSESDASNGSPGSDAAQGDAAAPPVTGACLGNPGQVVCADAVLNHCNELGQVERQETCPSARQCQLGIATKACAPCSPGTRRCTGVRLERCSEDGLTWELMKSCESEALCNAVAGDCVAGACTATTRACMNGDLYGCSQDLTQLSLLKPCTVALCDQTNGECDVCIANARTCNGTVAEACDNRGQTLTRTECTGTMPKCTGAGQCVQCALPTDCPTPASQCQAAACNASTARCGTTPRAAHATCTGGVCNGNGACVQCVDDTDCPNAGARKCSNARCVACVSNADCPATYECTTTQTCQKVSLAGTGTACLSTATPANGMCGGYYCGVSSARFSLAFDPASACGPNATFNCGGELEKITTKCWIDNAFANDSAGATRLCVQADPSVQSASIGTACIDCFVNEFQCCSRSMACLTACLISSGKSCDDEKKAAGCVSPLFTCAGLPNPL